MAQKSEMSTAEAIQKRQRLLDELNSDEHYERTETTNYGDHNPFDVVLVDCDTCKSSPRFEKVGPYNNRWDIDCPICKKRIQHPQVERWKAQLLWWQKNLSDHNYRELPLFNLATLDVPAARRRMAGIRRDLEIKKGIADTEELISRVTDLTPPGAEYRLRLDAYMGWAMLALSLMKREDGGSERTKRLEYLAESEQNQGVP